MKNFDLNNCGVQEMSTVEMREVDGGKVEYFQYHWVETDNPLIYAGSALVNGFKLIGNGGIWIYNQF